MPAVNKTRRILAAFESGQSLTSLDAINTFGVTRLAAVVHLLKKEGHDIQDKWVTVTDRFGNKCEVKEYWMPTGDPQLKLL